MSASFHGVVNCLPGNGMLAELADRAGAREGARLTGPVPVGSIAIRTPGISARFRPECATCRVRTFCLAAALAPEHVRLLDYVVVGRRAVHRGQALFRTGDPFDALYAVHGGFFKTGVLSRDGVEHVTGLRMAGDVLGLDAVHARRHTCDAVALDQSEVCVLPYANLLEQSLHNEALHHALHDLLGRELVRDQEHVVLLAGMWGVQRVAAFLLEVSERLQARGFSRSDFQLRMTRREIGSYLGIELETVSRIFSRLEREALIEVDRAHVTIRDLEGLARIAES